MQKTAFTLWVAMLLGLSATAQATLIDRGLDTLGNRLIYDDDLGITWYDFSAPMGNLATQINWASGLSVTLGSNTYADWRLPASNNITNCIGTGCTDSEMGHLYYVELGNTAGGPLANTGPFQNLKGDLYWSGTPSPLGGWAFGFGSGNQQPNWSTANYFWALAVRDGDVSAVPVPATVWLFGSGMMALLGVARRKLSDDGCA